MASSLFQNNQNQTQQKMSNTLALVKQMTEGQNPEKVFYDECKRRNVNPDDIMKVVKLFR